MAFLKLLLFLFSFLNFFTTHYAKAQANKTIPGIAADTLQLGITCDRFSPVVKQLEQTLLANAKKDSLAIVASKSLLVFREFNDNNKLVTYIEVPNSNYNSIFVQSQVVDVNFYPYYWLCEICFAGTEQAQAAYNKLNSIINHNDVYNAVDDHLLLNADRLIYFKSGNDKIKQQMQNTITLLKHNLGK